MSTVIVTNADIQAGESGSVVKETVHEVVLAWEAARIEDRPVVLTRPNQRKVAYDPRGINHVEES